MQPVGNKDSKGGQHYRDNAGKTYYQDAKGTWYHYDNSGNWYHYDGKQWQYWGHAGKGQQQPQQQPQQQQPQQQSKGNHEIAKFFGIAPPGYDTESGFSSDFGSWKRLKKAFMKGIHDDDYDEYDRYDRRSGFFDEPNARPRKEDILLQKGRGNSIVAITFAGRNVGTFRDFQQAIAHLAKQIKDNQTNQNVFRKNKRGRYAQIDLSNQAP